MDRNKPDHSQIDPRYQREDDLNGADNLSDASDLESLGSIGLESQFGSLHFQKGAHPNNGDGTRNSPNYYAAADDDWVQVNDEYHSNNHQTSKAKPGVLSSIVTGIQNVFVNMYPTFQELYYNARFRLSHTAFPTYSSSNNNPNNNNNHNQPK